MPQDHTAKRYADTIGIDWLQGTFPVQALDAFRDALARWGQFVVPRACAMYGYTSVEMAPNGCFLAWSAERPEGCFSIPGSVWAQLNAEQMLALLNELNAIGFRCTRMDIRFDDYRRLVSPREVYEAAKAGNIHGFRSFTYYESAKSRCHGGHAMPAGETCELGRRGKNGSGAAYVIYDKLLESGDADLDCIRWELRLYKERSEGARLVLSQCRTASELITRLGEFVGGHVCFLDRSSGDKNLERLPRLAWWTAITDSIGRAKVRVRRIRPTLLAAMQSIEKQYGSTLLAIQKGLNALGGDFYDFIGDVLASGKERFGRVHESRVREFIDQESELVLCEF